VPVFQFTFFTDDGPDVYVIEGAAAMGEAVDALFSAREFELPSPYDICEFKMLTANSVIRVGDAG
jgi:hypothetical protein